MGRRRRPRSLLQARLYPFLDVWIHGPGLTSSLPRPMLMGSWFVESPQETEDQSPLVRAGVLYPELPFSIMPRSVQQDLGLSPLATPPLGWQGRPIPTWRGIPCRLGSALFRVINDLDPDDPFLFRVFVLLPDREPPGPHIEHVLLGAEFLAHYGLRVVVDYARLASSTTASGSQRKIDESIPWGVLEKD
jgi:hypothetical protein